MAPKRLTTFWKVKSIVSLFVQMGCELHSVPGTIHSADGEVLDVRYLFNPDNASFVPIVDLADEDFVSAGEVSDWERRLGIAIPKPTI